MNGQDCEHQRHQINFFMAAFFGGFLGADQWYAESRLSFLHLCHPGN
jgi:hypothetical protein